MTPNQLSPSDLEEAEQVALQCYANLSTAFSEKLKCDTRSMRVFVETIARALSARAQQERERIKKHLESLDPLKAIADWENAEDIAYAVQSFIVDNIREAAK